MNSKRQHGSALTVIIIIAAMLLVVSAGYMLLVKLNVVPAFGQSKTASNTDKSSNLKTASFDKSFGIAMSFQYPKSWSIDTKQEGQFPVTAKSPAIETFTLLAPDKSYSVVYRLVAGAGRGTTCGEKDGGVIAALETASVNGWKGAEFARLTTKSSTGSYLSQAGLVAPVSLMHVKVGSNACQLTVGALNVPSMTLTLNLVDASIHPGTDTSTSTVADAKEFATESAAKRVFSGRSYDEAKAILRSTTLQ